MSRILLIDDEKSIRSLGKRVLEGAGYDVSLAEDGLSAIELFKVTPFDLIITDLMLPGEPPLNAVREIKKKQQQCAGFGDFRPRSA